MNKLVSAWLLTCCALVLAILVSGGVTRLTRSGLSIVEWKPVIGTLPPLSSDAWNDAFAKYRRTPEYQEINAGMTLEQFKPIFWMEYAHRLLGRLAGIIFVGPFLYLMLGRRLEKRLAVQLGAIALLWAAQGALGWYMVSSGLIDQPHVSPIRLTAHLALGCLLYGAMFWTALGPRPGAPAGPNSMAKFVTALIGFVFLTILSGGLVAGLKAGLAYNTFPLMAGHWIPPFFDAVTAAQFAHRALASLLALSVLFVWIVSRFFDSSRSAKTGFSALLGVMGLQAGLGILTLLYRVPIPLGVAHQAAALLVLTGALYLRHEL